MFLSPFGYKVPEDQDKSWWDYLIFNILRSASHSHNGTDSPTLSATSFTKLSQSLTFSNWVADTLGLYKQTVEMPAGITFTNFAPLFFVNGGADDGQQLHLDYKKEAANQYTLYTNNPNLSVRVLYV